MTHEQKALRWTVAGVVVAGVVGAGALVPVYWGYVCRYQGRLCESSPIAPPNENAINKNRDALSASLSTGDANGAFSGINAVRHLGWFSRDRVDIVARTKHGDDLVVDSLSLSSATLLSTYRDEASGVLIVATSQPATVGGNTLLRASIIHYHATRQIQKRVATIDCGEVGPLKHKPQLELRNFAFRANKLIFDILSNCDGVYVNAQFKVQVDRSRSGSRFNYGDTIFGATAIASLGPDFHLQKVETQRDIDDAAQREVELVDCASRFAREFKKVNPSAVEGIGACWVTEPTFLGSQTDRVRVFTTKGDEVHLVEEDTCSGSRAGFTIGDHAEQGYVAVACVSTHDFRDATASIPADKVSPKWVSRVDSSFYILNERRRSVR